ncbi:MAG: hypothetical protein RSF40_10935 [Oscillospiraceae bacterium]
MNIPEQLMKIPEKMTFDREGNIIETTYIEVDPQVVADVIIKIAKSQMGNEMK